MGGMGVEDVARRLRERREALGLDLTAAQEATRIRMRYLQALEAADASVFPGEVYLKGYLRSYCEFLGLEPRTIIEDYERERMTATAGDSPPVPAGPQEGPADEAAAQGGVPTSGRSRRSRRYGLGGPDPLAARQPRAWWLGAAVILAVIASAWYWTGYPVSRHAGAPTGSGPAGGPAPTASEETSEAGGRGPAPSETAGPSEAGKPAVAVTRSTAADGSLLFTVDHADSLSVRLTFTGDCWVVAEADGVKTAEGRTYHAGEEAAWTAASRLLLIAGYPPALQLNVNGLDQGVLDPVKRVRYVRVVLAAPPSR